MQKEEAKEILIERNRCYKEENMEHPLFIQAIDVAIQALSNDRPAPDRDGAEEVLKNLFGSGSFQFSYSIDQCLQAMTTHARNEVAKAVAEKDAEIEKYFNESQKLATKHGKLYGKALAELTAAKKRIEELENRTEMKLPHNYKPQ